MDASITPSHAHWAAVRATWRADVRVDAAGDARHGGDATRVKDAERCRGWEFQPGRPVDVPWAKTA